MSIKSLIINPGSTSTKIGVFEDETLLFEETLISASPWIGLSVAPLCFAASASMARSRERGPSTIQSVISPSLFMRVSSAASTVTGIFGLTTSTAARGATFGKT